MTGRDRQVIRSVIDRLHVSASERAVAREIYRRLPRHKLGRKYRRARHEWIRYAVKHHRRNRELYRHVMGGIR